MDVRSSNSRRTTSIFRGGQQIATFEPISQTVRLDGHQKQHRYVVEQERKRFKTIDFLLLLKGTDAIQRTNELRSESAYVGETGPKILLFSSQPTRVWGSTCRPGMHDLVTSPHNSTATPMGAIKQKL